MNYKEDFIAQLMNGKSVDDLAAELTKAINEANDAAIAQREKDRLARQEAERARKAAEQHNADRLSAIENLLDSMYWVADAYDLHNLADLFENTSAEEIKQVFDELLPLLQEYVQFMAALSEAEPKGEVRPAEARPVSDPINDFLNKFVRS